MSENFETITCSSARQFLDLIRRSNPRWLESNATLTPWLFRGQGNSEWKLIPSAWRPGIDTDSNFQAVIATITDEIVNDVVEANLDLIGNLEFDAVAVRRQIAQRRFEFLQVQAFTSLADELGMHVPGGSISHEIPHSLILRDSPHPAYALAQHHGMATRLLDWTQNPLNAAFFAAEQPDEPLGAIAVWALNGRALLDSEWLEYRVPRSQVGFVHSQAGLFTYHKSADLQYAFDCVWPSIEQVCSPKSLKKLVLPSREAKELRRLLFAEGVSRAHLMPTFDNIKETLKALSENSADD